MLRGDPTRDGVTRGCLLGVACLLALGAFGLAFADALDGVLEVHSAYVNIDKGVFMLHARVEYPVSPVIRSALRDGVTLTFDLEARVDRDRRYWLNSTIVDLTLRRELNYHAVSDRYVVNDTKTDDQVSFPTLDEALDYLGTGGRLADTGRAAAGRRQLHHQRARRRAPRPPAGLAPRAYCSGPMTGHASSEWYSWSLPV